MIKRAVLTAGILSLMIGFSGQAVKADTVPEVKVPAIEMDYKIDFTKNLSKYNFLTSEEKAKIEKEAEASKPHYDRIEELSAKADKIERKIMKEAKPLDAKYDAIYAKNMELWMKLDSEVFENLNDLSNVGRVQASKELTKEEKAVLLADAKEFDKIEAAIAKIQAKADKAVEKIDAQIAKEYKALDKISAANASIWRKIVTENDGK